MASEPVCAQCGTPLPENAPGNRCPKCLLELGLKETANDDAGSQSEAEGGQSPEGAPEADLVVEQPGTMIGRYKLLQQIGEGGFGVVFMAEQTEPIQRKVALKVIKAGMDTREIIARFEAERQALALMDHPNIARVLDGGATASRRPYFVMELVKGIPITEYCDQANLTTRERLELFIKVCRAVQHAHQKGVIHRDLKPTNVLVTLHDGEAVPKVIDFGVAKALGQKLTEKTLFTRFEQMIGTPAYMSPEQAALGGLDIDTRSDIYSLGVLLYELLTGVTPLDAETARQAGLDEIRRLIRETDPPRPSTRLQTLGKRLAEVARCRHVESTALSRLVRGDLDWITMKCLDKDRQRRYETVSGLARDIERHLNNEPVVARPPSRLYEFQKTVRRHKVGFAAASAVIAALSIGVVVSTWQAVRARKAEREQEQAKHDATQKLWASYLAEARAGRRSGESGQRFDSLAALSNAAAIRPSLELRNEAIACMALADLRVIDEKHKVFKYRQEFANADTTLQNYALGGTNGEVSIRQVKDDRELVRLPSIGAGPVHPGMLSFNSVGNLLAVTYADGRTVIWDLPGATIRREVSAGQFTLSLDFKILMRLESNSIAFYDTATGQKQRQIYLERRAFGFCLCSSQPIDRPVALVGDVEDTTILILDINSGKTLSILNHPKAVLRAAWCPGSSFLAAACDDNLIYIWDTVTGQTVRTLAGHKNSPVSVDFSHDGTLLVSSGYDGRTLLWNFATGRQLVGVPVSGGVSFGVDDRAVAALAWDLQEVAFLEVEAGKEVRTIYEVGRVSGAPNGGAYFSRSGRLLAYSRTNGATIYDVQAQREIGSVEGPLWISGFAPGDHSVLGVLAPTDGDGQLFHWDTKSESNGELKPAEQIELGGKAYGASTLSADGKYLITMGHGRAQVVRTDTLAEIAHTGVQPGMTFAAMSPDGKWLATGPFHGHGVKIWEAQTAKLVKDLPFEEVEEEGTTVTFSPDGHWLVCGTGLQYQFWEVGTWAAGLHIKQQRGSMFMPVMAFSPDGSILAGTFGFYKVRLFNAATGEILADIEAPDPWQVTCLSFSPDGSQLAVCEGHHALRLWDLRRVRERLARMHLDWDLPPYAPTTPSVSAANVSPISAAPALSGR